MVEVAREYFPSATFKQLTVYNLAELKTKFDGFWCCNVLLHIPRARINEALAAINGTLKPNAIGLIVTKDGDKEDFEVREKEGRHEERLFTYWRKDDFTKILDDTGFRVIEYS